MSAAIYLRRREASYLLVDAASYLQDGTIVSIADKCIPLPELHCAFTTFGPVGWTPILANAMRLAFRSFDELVAGIESLSRAVFQEAHAIVTSGPSSTCELWAVGWSVARQRVEGFQLVMLDDDEWARWNAKNPGLAQTRSPFVRDDFHVHIAANPVARPQSMEEAIVFPRLSDPEQIDPELDLLHLMEAQRRTRFDDVNPYRIGGYALLTRVDASGISQRRIHEWHEDKVGAVITPEPMNWAKWRAERRRSSRPGPRLVAARAA